MSDKHSPEPWELYDANVGALTRFGPRPDPYGGVGCTYGGTCPPGVGLANAAHIIACVNACAGINPEAVPDLLKVCKDLKACIRQDDYVSEETLHAALRLVDAALAKAKAKP